MDRETDLEFASFRRDGDPAALAAVFDETAPEILRVAMHLARDTASAEDLLQATFVTAIEAAASWDPARPVLPWLLGILANHGKRAHAKRRASPLPDADPADPASAPARAAEESEVSSEVLSAIDALPEPYRRALLLKLAHGLEPIEIAHLLDVPPPTARSWIRRGLEKLRKALPAGFAASALLAFPAERGLAAVKAAVLSHVPPVPALAGAAAVAGGALVMKKTLVVAAVLVLLAAGGAVVLGPWSDEDPAEPPLPTVDLDGLSGKTPSEEDAAPARRDLPPPVDFSKVDRERDVHGVVVRADGSPVAGARVVTVFRVWGSPHAWTAEKEEDREGPAAVTAVDGSFSIALERGALCRLEVFVDEQLAVRLDWAQAGERVRIVLPAAARLVVAVKDEAAAPVAGARLSLGAYTPEGYGSTQKGVTGEDGTFAFTSAPAGRKTTVRIAHDDYAPARKPGVVMPLTGETRVDVTLVVGWTIRGRVLDAETGEPIAGATIYGEPRDFDRVTNAEGEFAFAGFVAPDEKHVFRSLHAAAEGYAEDDIAVREPAEIEFRLTRGTSVAGRVVDDSGAPVAGASLSVSGRAPQGRRFAFRTTSDTGGRFRVSGVPHDLPGTVVVTATGHGRVLYDFDPAGEPGGSVDLGDFVLPAPGAVFGVVQDGDGTPIPRAKLYLDGSNPDRASRRGGSGVMDFALYQEYRRTDDLGRFRYPDIAPGRYVLRAWLSDGRSRSAEVEVRARMESRVDVRFGAGIVITVTVADDRGEPVGGISVWTQTDAGSFRATSDARGVALLTVEGEPGFLGINDQDRRYVSPWMGGQRRKIAAGTREVGFTVWPAGEVAGTVLDDTGKPAWGAQVRVAVDGGTFMPRFTDQQGRFEMPAPARGEFDLEAERESLSGKATGVTAREGEVTIRLGKAERNRSLTVVARDPDGRPLPGVRVSFGRKFGTTDEAGRVTLERLMDRRSYVRVQPSEVLAERGLSAPRLELILPRGQEVVLRFRRLLSITGRVVDADGSPVVGAMVSALSTVTHEVIPNTRTDTEGRFEIGVPEDAGATIRVTAYVGKVERQGYASGVSPGDRDVVIRLGERR